MVLTVDLIAFSAYIYLPDEAISHPLIQEVILECIRSAALMSDIFSYHRKCILMGSDFNLIAVIQCAFDLLFEKALDPSIGFINDIIRSFLEKERRLLTFGDEGIDNRMQAYDQGLKDQIIAAWHWQMSATNRYRSPDSPFWSYESSYNSSYPITE